MKERIKKYGLTILASLLIVISLILIFNKPIEHWLVGDNQAKAIKQLTKDDIKRNLKKQGDFDFGSVKSINAADALKSKFASPLTIGALAVPAVNLRLPVVKGLSNVNMSTGGATMRENQKMGEGNYPLAGHYMTNSGNLFSPLERTHLGEHVYLTDLDYVYDYVIYYKQVVSPKAVYLVNDTKEKQVTLITCADGGVYRWAIRAKLVDKMAANNSNLKVFGL